MYVDFIMPVWSGTFISPAISEHWNKYKDMFMLCVRHSPIFCMYHDWLVVLNLSSLLCRQQRMDMIIMYEIFNGLDRLLMRIFLMNHELLLWNKDIKRKQFMYLDLQKAFDKVSHQRLLSKLKTHGIYCNTFYQIARGQLQCMCVCKDPNPTG